jgi:hypothetical protein
MKKFGLQDTETNDIHRQINMSDHKRMLCNQLEKRNKELIEHLERIRKQQTAIKIYSEIVDLPT